MRLVTFLLLNTLAFSVLSAEEPSDFERGLRTLLELELNKFESCLEEGKTNCDDSEVDNFLRLLDEGRRILHLHYTKHRDERDPYPLSTEHYDMIKAIRNQNEDAADKLAHQHTRLFHQRIMDFFKVNYVEDV